MYLIAGLGNPGLKYSATRHNVGFEVIERFAYNNNISLNKKKFESEFGQGVIKGEKVILIKPQTYMNNSGISVKAFNEYYNIEPDKVIIIYDDVSLDLGKLRIRKKGSAGGHNGIKSIISHLGTQEFLRIKVDVGQKPPGYDLADYVLSKFSKSEIQIIIDEINKASDSVEAIIENGLEYAMNNLNASN